MKLGGKKGERNDAGGAEEVEVEAEVEADEEEYAESNPLYQVLYLRARFTKSPLEQCQSRLVDRLIPLPLFDR